MLILKNTRVLPELTPGFIDAHVHLDLCGMNTFEENVQPDAYRGRPSSFVERPEGLPAHYVEKSRKFHKLMIDKEVGTVEPGKKANLVLINGRPDQDIKAAGEVRTVVKGGRIVNV